MEILKVEPYRQRPSYCGPASLKMVLGYYGASYSEKYLARIAGCTFKAGTPARGLVKAARSCGFSASYRDRCSVSDIRETLRRGIPPIVNWFSVDEGHYSVAVGMDRANIWLQDPEHGQLRSLRIETFQRVWFDFGGSYMKTKDDLILRRMIVVENRD